MAITSGSSTANAFAWLLVLLWLCATGYGLWYFQMKDLRPFETVSAVVNNADFNQSQFDDTLIRASIVRNNDRADIRATVINFWNPACACNRFNEQHIQRIIANYQTQGIRFVTVTDKKHFNDAAIKQARLKFDTELMSSHVFNDTALPPLSPSAAILNHEGKLVYLGPFSSGVFCGTGKTQFVEEAITKILEGETVSLPQQNKAFGCYCES